MCDSGNIKVYLISTDQSSTSIFVFECKLLNLLLDNDEITL